MLWSKTVVGADDHAIDPRGEMYATELFVIEGAQYITSTVEEDQCPERSCPARRGVDPDREVRRPAAPGSTWSSTSTLGSLGSSARARSCSAIPSASTRRASSNIVEGDLYVEREHRG